MNCDFTPISKRQTWAPEFQDQTKHLYLIEGFQPIQECPVSAISAEAREAVVQWERIEFGRQSTGTTWRDPALANWPPHDVETAILLSSAENCVTNAKIRSESAHTKRQDKIVDEGED